MLPFRKSDENFDKRKLLKITPSNIMQRVQPPDLNNFTELLEKSAEDRTLEILQKHLVARRYSPWHDRFLCYRDIVVYLRDLQAQYGTKMYMQHLKNSAEKRPLWMIRIRSPLRRTKMACMIEAGSDGKEKMTVSTALYLIDYLVKNNVVPLMEFFIIPCLNPDGYENTLKCKKTTKITKQNNLSSCFPKDLPPSLNPTPQFNIFPIQPPQEPVYVEPNCFYLMETLDRFKSDIKLFISLQAKENALTYPLDNYFREVFTFALASKDRIGRKDLKVRPMVPDRNKPFGTSVEYVKRNLNEYIKFAYIFNVHGAKNKLDPKKIMETGEQSLKGILALIKKVYKFHTKGHSTMTTMCTVKKID